MAAITRLVCLNIVSLGSHVPPYIRSHLQDWHDRNARSRASKVT
jgi:hypothetical protein